MGDPYIKHARECEVMRRCQEEFDHRLPPGAEESDYDDEEEDE